MSIVGISHGYPPLWNMGGEVSLHRTLKAARGDKHVLTNTDQEYTFDNVKVHKIDAINVLDIRTDSVPIAKQLVDLDAKVVIAQNELSLAAVKASSSIGTISIVSVHTPPIYGRNLAQALYQADYGIYNTRTSAIQWGEPNALVIHPPISPLPTNRFTDGDAYTVLSSLKNKGVEIVLGLAKIYKDKRFIIVRSPAERTHGIPDLEERVKQLPNVELHPRVSPDEVKKYYKQTRILLVPSRYETYGMSAIEAAGYGIPTIHVDTPHVREGIGEAAFLVRPLNLNDTARGIDTIEQNYELYSSNARKRAEWLDARQKEELEQFADFIDNIEKPDLNTRNNRKRAMTNIIYRLTHRRFI